MKKVKEYHILKYNLEHFIKKYSVIYTNNYNLNISKNEYVIKSFGDKKYTYNETIKKVDTLNRVYYNRVSYIRNLYDKHKLKESDYLKKQYNNTLFNLSNGFIKDFSNILTIKRIDYRRVYINYKRYRNNRDVLSESNFLRIIRNDGLDIININYLEEFINKYYNTKEEFIISLIGSEICFIKSFNKLIAEIGVLLGFKYKEILLLCELIEIIYGGRHYNYKNKYKLSNKKWFNEIFIGFLKKYLWMDNTSQDNILKLIQYLDLDYQQSKYLIFYLANKCTGTIMGDKTLDSYNINKFEDILNKEDWDTLINNVIYIGNNSNLSLHKDGIINLIPIEKEKEIKSLIEQ